MLNLNHPRTDIIFETSTFLDRLKNSCRVYIVQPYEERQETFLMMKIVCEDLLVFSKENHSESFESIASITHEIIQEIELLEKMNILSEEGHCKVCNQPLKTWYSGVKEFGDYTSCTHCPNLLIKLVNNLEMLTGVWAI